MNVKMKSTILMVIVFVLFQFTVQTAVIWAAGDNNMKQTVDIKGMIEYNAKTGGYTLVTHDPPSTLFIVNQNKKVLEKYSKRGKTVTVKGHYKGSADYLIIDQIEGQKYKGK